MTPPIVKRFLIALDQHKLIGFFTFALMVLGSGVFLVLQKPPEVLAPTYKATGVLAYKPQPPAFTSLGQQLQEQGRAINKDMLLSNEVKNLVAIKLKIDPQIINKLIEKEQIKVNFPKEGEPQRISLEYSDEKEDRSQLLLNTFMETMVEFSRLVNSAQFRAKIESLESRLGQVRNDLKGAEAKLYRYISREGSDLLAIQDGSLFSGITGSQQQQREIQRALEGLDAEINTLVNQLNLTPQQAYTSSALSADPIIASLRAQILQTESQLELLGRERRPEHPEMVRLIKEKQTSEQLLLERAAEVIGKDGILASLTPAQIRQQSNLDSARRELATKLIGLQSQRENLVKQLASIQRTENDLRQQYEKFPEKQIEQARLVQEVESKRALYQNILSVLVDAQSAEAETVGSLTIEQKAAVEKIEPEPQVAINPVIVIGAGIGLGFVSAMGVIFLLATLDARLHTAQELRSALGDREVLLLGELPFIITFEDESPILVDSDSIYLPAYERFRSNLRRLGTEPPKVVLLTSISSEEGKTISAYNLAIASAQAGKRTLLIEADLRSATAAKALNLTLDSDASIEPLRYYGSKSDCIRLVPEVANLYVVPSPGPQRQAAAIVESSELRRLIDDARQRFDMVIIDTPSLSSSNDVLLLEPLTDGIVLVTRPGYTQGNLLGETIDQLTEAELPLLGAVINGVEKAVIPTNQLKEKLNFDYANDELITEEDKDIEIEETEAMPR